MKIKLFLILAATIIFATACNSSQVKQGQGAPQTSQNAVLLGVPGLQGTSISEPTGNASSNSQQVSTSKQPVAPKPNPKSTTKVSSAPIVQTAPATTIETPSLNTPTPVPQVIQQPVYTPPTPTVDNSQAQQQAALAAQQAQQQKTNQINALTSAYNTQINTLNQQILGIKSQYYSDLTNIESDSGDMAAANGRAQNLLNTNNAKIAQIQDQEQQLYINYESQIGSIQ
jgi:outer membrane biosynthesis protein TonB